MADPTPDALARLRTLVAEATPLPWIESFCGPQEIILPGEPSYRRIAKTGVEHGVFGPNIGVDRPIANGELIVAAVNAFSDFLDLVVYTRHLPDCSQRHPMNRQGMPPYPCTCGLDAHLTRLGLF